MCIKNKNYMENWLFWGLNLGNLKQCMMIMLVLTSSSSAWTLCSLLHISSLINICNFYSFWATGMVLTSKWGRILQEIHCQCQIWLNCPAAGRRPANFHKRNYLLSVNTTDFEKTTIQAHSALVAIICYFTLKQAGDQVLGLFLGNESLVWLSAANQIHLTKSVCPSINLFTYLSVQQPIHPPTCPLVYFQSMSMFFYLYVHLSSCSSMHEPWSTCMSVQPYHIS